MLGQYVLKELPRLILLTLCGSAFIFECLRVYCTRSLACLSLQKRLLSDVLIVSDEFVLVRSRVDEDIVCYTCILA